MMTFSDGALDDDAILHIASYLEPGDFVCLALTCRRFGSKMGAATGRERRMMARDAKRQKASVRDWSLMDEAARSVMEKTQTEVERACLPLRDGESWMSRYNELTLLRTPLTFDQLVGDCAHSASNDKSMIWAEYRGAIFSESGTALSDHVMRAGKHYATFTSQAGDGTRVGVLRPIHGLDTKGLRFNLSTTSPPPKLMKEMTTRWGIGKVNYCTFRPRTATGKWSDCAGTKYGSGNTEHIHSLQGLGLGQFPESDTIGLLLDLDEGTLTVYRNGRRLGLLKSGLTGEYCWCTEIFWYDGDRPSLKISRGSIPS